MNTLASLILIQNTLTVLYSIFLPPAARKWRKEKPFKGERVCVLDRLR